ncbi:MAG: hypothetical protein WC755_05580 [Candidatus Woesearchaeota archaeon]|jgi:hypothetical protein
MIYYYIKIKQERSPLWEPYKEDDVIPVFYEEECAKKYVEKLFLRNMIMPISHLPSEQKSCIYNHKFKLIDMMPVNNNFNLVDIVPITN